MTVAVSGFHRGEPGHLIAVSADQAAGLSPAISR